MKRTRRAAVPERVPGRGFVQAAPVAGQLVIRHVQRQKAEHVDRAQQEGEVHARRLLVAAQRLGDERARVAEARPRFVDGERDVEQRRQREPEREPAPVPAADGPVGERHQRQPDHRRRLCRCGSIRQATGSTAAQADSGRSRSLTTASSASTSNTRNAFGFQTRSANSALHGEHASSAAAKAAAASPNGRRSAYQNIQTDAAPISSKNTLPASGARVKSCGKAASQYENGPGSWAVPLVITGPSIGKRTPCAMSMRDRVVARLVAGEAGGLHQRQAQRGRRDEDRRPDPEGTASPERHRAADACNTGRSGNVARTDNAPETRYDDQEW